MWICERLAESPELVLELAWQPAYDVPAPESSLRMFSCTVKQRLLLSSPLLMKKSKGGNTARNQRLSDPNLGNLVSAVAFLLLQMSPMILLYEERKNSRTCLVYFIFFVLEIVSLMIHTGLKLTKQEG